jgi:16S rRNA (uracil1498-N3)-methyltransferase
MCPARFLISPYVLSGSRGTFTLTGREAHHLTHVKRFGPGDRVELVDGSGIVAEAKIVWINRSEVGLQIVEVSKQPNDCLPINLIVALLKADRMGWMIQKATELGVQAIYPVITQHTVIKVDPEKISRYLVRWNDIAGQALKQCRGSIIPTIHAVTPLGNALGKIPCAGAKILLWEEEKKRSLFSAWRDQKNTIPVTVITGPEGGFVRDEIVTCKKAGFNTATMGIRTLRSETAAIGAVASLAAIMNSCMEGKS